MTSPPLSAVSVDEANAFLHANVTFASHMNLTCLSMTPGVGVAKFTFDEKWTRPGGIVCGPVLMAAADIAVYLAIFTRAGIVPMSVTNDLTITFLRPAIGSDIHAIGRLHKLGRKVAYASVDLVEPHAPDRLVAQASSSYIMPDEART